MSTEIRLAMLGMIEGNGHPYSWSGIINGYNPTEMAKCPYAGIPVYMGRQPLESVRIPGARVTHIWCDDPADAPKVAAASLIEHVVANPEDVIGHVDAAVMRVERAGWTLRSDLSATLFLCDPDDYDGGELLIETEYGAQAVKLPAGSLVLYPSSSLHQVTAVTRGARVCAFFWIQSLVRDSAERALLYDLDQTLQALRSGLPIAEPSLLTLHGIYHNLLRRWAEV